MYIIQDECVKISAVRQKNTFDGQIEKLVWFDPAFESDVVFFRSDDFPAIGVM